VLAAKIGKSQKSIKQLHKKTSTASEYEKKEKEKYPHKPATRITITETPFHFVIIVKRVFT